MTKFYKEIYRLPFEWNFAWVLQNLNWIWVDWSSSSFSIEFNFGLICEIFGFYHIICISEFISNQKTILIRFIISIYFILLHKQINSKNSTWLVITTYEILFELISKLNNSKKYICISTFMHSLERKDKKEQKESRTCETWSK